MSLKNLVLVVGIVGAYAWYTDNKQNSKIAFTKKPATLLSPAQAVPKFSCEGKTRCPQMTSCEEAMFYINNCPGTEMDGDHDGIPCESQWCG